MRNPRGRDGMTSIHLLGGGSNAATAPVLFGPFLDRAGPAPVVACILLDEGDGASYFTQWAAALMRTAVCEPVPVFVQPGGSVAVTDLGDADAMLVCGGLTPAYAAALAPVAPAIRAWLAEGDRPYAGSSAGAAVAATHALVGGWLDRGLEICPEEVSEDLEEISIVPGLGLVDYLIDVHCAQWGTLPRLIAAVEESAGGRGLAIDENTAVHLADGVATVAGVGAAREVIRRPEGPTVRTYRALSTFPVA
jgi:cyanophycinase